MAGGPASAAPPAPVSLVVWAGGVGPGTPLRGAILQPDGKGRLLSVAPAARAAGKVTVGGAFAPSAAQLKAIRGAAAAAAGAPGVRVANVVAGGSYAAATVRVGSKKASLIGVNAGSAALRHLLAQLNAALPKPARLTAPAPEPAKSVSGPETAPLPCPEGQNATNISKQLSLKEAANAGILTLKAKPVGTGSPLGVAAGDAVAVDLDWAPTPPGTPVVVRVNIEITAPDGAPWETRLEQAVEGKLAGLRASDGTPVKFDLVVKRRALGAPRTPCFHQIALQDDPRFASYTRWFHGHPFIQRPGSGRWASGKSDPEREALEWTHETLHLAGLHDQYGRVFFSKGGGAFAIPASVDTSDQAALSAWAKSAEVDISHGIIARPDYFPGHRDDIMSCCVAGVPLSSYRVFQPDIDWFATAGAGRLTVRSSPGDLLLNKNGERQNMGVGAPFEVTATPARRGHADGLVAYCIDANRPFPARGDGYDVLGPAADQPHPGMQALQKVLAEVARRQPAPLEDTPGALRAVWRVTDDQDPGDDADARAILAAAGIDPAQKFDSPHYTDPNAGSPETAAVTPTETLPRAPASPADPRATRPPRARLAALAVSPRRARAARRPLLLTVRMDLADAGDVVTMRFERRVGRGWRDLVRSRRHAFPRGTSLVSVLLPRPPGSYRVRVTGAFGSSAAGFSIVSARGR